ncbi:MAG: MFS transporter [Clostridia bacterium]|nr:MFS transporter [Clostridia bacterium]
MAQTNQKAKKSIFDSPIMSSKIKSANAKIFPEGGLGYFIGPTLALISNSVLSGQYNQYLTDVMKVPAWFLWFLPVISVIFVVAGNILVGKLMDNMRTRAGKARPLILISIPISLVALLLLLVFPPLNNGENQLASLIFIAIGYNMWFAIAYPFYYTSHAALVNLSTRNSKDRSLLATISNATTLAAMGLTSMILPFASALFFPTENDVVIADKAYVAWKVIAIIMIAITAIGAIIEFFFTRERITEESINSGVEEVKKAVPMGQQAKVCFRDKFWIMIMVFFFLYQLGGMLKNVSQIYFCRAAFTNLTLNMNEGQSFSGLLAIIGAIPTAVGMVISWPLSNKIGKGKAIALGAIVSTIGGAIGFIDPSNFTLVVVAFVVKALGSTPAMYLSLALLADVLDHQEAKHGFRTDGLSMTIYGAIMAGMTGVATGIMNAVLGAFDFSGMASAGAGTEAFKWAMTFIFLGGETVCFAIIAIIFAFMKVEKFSKFDHKAIVMDQRAAAEAEGREYIDPQTKMKMEEEQAEADSIAAKRQEIIDACKAKGLDEKQALEKFEKQLEAERQAKEAKLQQEQAKKAAAEKAKADALAKMTAEQKARYEAKIAKKLAEEEAVRAEFNKMREAEGRQPVPAE